MKEIQLSKGLVSLVDDDDFESLNKHRWCAGRSKRGIHYARRTCRVGKEHVVYLHREVLKDKIKDTDMVDHIDKNGLNNQKHNLRICTRAQNKMNSRKQENTSSRFKGVSYYKKRNNWRARIKINKKLIDLGSFATEEEAAIVYNKKAVEIFGEFSSVNIVSQVGLRSARLVELVDEVIG